MNENELDAMDNTLLTWSVIDLLDKQQTSKVRNPRLKMLPKRIGAPSREKANTIAFDIVDDQRLADLCKAFRKLELAQINLRKAFGNSSLLTRIIQEGECRVCSANELEKADGRVSGERRWSA